MSTSRPGPSVVISDWRVAPIRVNGETIFAIGDVHGCADHLSLLIQKLEAEAKGVSSSRLIFLGDLLFRDPRSLGALALWSAPDLDDSFKNVDRLWGNHEQLLSFPSVAAASPKLLGPSGWASMVRHLLMS